MPNAVLWRAALQSHRRPKTLSYLLTEDWVRHTIAGQHLDGVVFQIQCCGKLPEGPRRIENISALVNTLRYVRERHTECADESRNHDSIGAGCLLQLLQLLLTSSTLTVATIRIATNPQSADATADATIDRGQRLNFGSWGPSIVPVMLYAVSTAFTRNRPTAKIPAAPTAMGITCAGGRPHESRGVLPHRG